MAAYFWLVVVLKIRRLEAVKSHDVFLFFYFFIVPFAAPNDWMVCPPSRALLPTRFRYIIPSNAATDFGLIVV